MTKAEVIRGLRRNQIRHLFPPRANWGKVEIQVRSSKNWATCELIERVQEKPTADPIEVIRDFVDDMDDGAAEAKCSEAWIMFSAAKELGQEILDDLEQQRGDENDFV